MKKHFAHHLIEADASVLEALARLDKLAADAVLFLVDDAGRLVSSLTDGDIRRGLLQGKELSHPLNTFTQAKPKFITRSGVEVETLRRWRADNFRIIPVVDDDHRIVDMVNFRKQRSFLPLDAVIMAGGLGTRLRPLTEKVPKPMLKVGGKPILAHNVERLFSFGVRNLTISINYLGEQIIDYFGDGAEMGMNIRYVTEEEPRGTIGAVSEIASFSNDNLLVMNSDLLTTIDFEDMFARMRASEADMIVATVPYEVKVPYGVIETEGELITALREKPTYTYYSNAGIYLLKRSHVGRIPPTGRFGAPDLMEALYTTGHRVVHYPILGYWLDIGKHADYAKAQTDIEHLKL